MATIFLTHDSDALTNIYGEAALAGLREVAEVRLNGTGKLLPTDALVEQSAGCGLIVADVNTPADASFFDRATDLVAFLRCAVFVSAMAITSSHVCALALAHPGSS